MRTNHSGPKGRRMKTAVSRRSAQNVSKQAIKRGEIVMQSKTVFVIFIALFFCLSTVTTCATDSTDDDTGPMIGLVVDLTGELSHIGTYIERAIDMAVSEVNTAGGLFGKNLRLVTKDSQLDGEKAVKQASALASQGALGIVGEMASSNTIAVAEQVTKEAKVLQCSGGSTSPSITDLDDDGFLYRTVTSDTYQGKALAEIIKEAGHTKAAVYYESGAFGIGLKDVFTEEFKKQGGTVVLALPHETDIDDVTADVAKLEESEATALLLVAYTDAGAKYLSVIRADSNFSSLKIYVTDAMLSNDLSKNIGVNLVAGLIGTAGESSKSADSGVFQDNFKKKWNMEPVIYSAEYYDCAITMILAQARAGENATPEEVKAALHEVTNAPGTAVSINTLKTALEKAAAGEDIDWSGPTDVEIDANGDQTRGVIAVYKYDNEGKLVLLEEKQLGI